MEVDTDYTPAHSRSPFHHHSHSNGPHGGAAVKRGTEDEWHECLWMDCTKSFSAPGELFAHLETHTAGLPAGVTCECRWGVCELEYDDPIALMEHMKEHVPDFKPFLCPFCDHATADGLSLQGHIRRQHSRKPARGSQPQFAKGPTTTKQRASEHGGSNAASESDTETEAEESAGDGKGDGNYESEENDGVPENSATETETETEGAAAARPRERRGVVGGDNDDDKNACMWAGCGRRFHDQGELYQHLRDDHTTKDLRCLWLGCSRGDVPLSSTVSMRVHHLTHVPHYRPHKCPDCSATFKHKQSLDEHRKHSCAKGQGLVPRPPRKRDRGRGWDRYPESSDEENGDAAAPVAAKTEQQSQPTPTPATTTATPTPAPTAKPTTAAVKQEHNTRKAWATCRWESCGMKYTSVSEVTVHVMAHCVSGPPWLCKWGACKTEYATEALLKDHVMSVHTGFSLQ